MKHPGVRGNPPSSGFEIGIVAIGGVLIFGSTVVRGGAWLAASLSGGELSASLAETMGVTKRLASNPGDPAQAWAEHASGLPGPWLYWMCTVFLLVVVSGVA